MRQVERVVLGRLRLDLEGRSLESPMPQWQLTIPEWTDLLAYLKTLN